MVTESPASCLSQPCARVSRTVRHVVLAVALSAWMVIEVWAATEARPGGMPNPHGDMVYKATPARTCSDCHGPPREHGGPPTVRDGEMVRLLIAKGKGNHGPGRFADCYRCHAGGRLPGADAP
jgi:hypothetical protein